MNIERGQNTFQKIQEQQYELKNNHNNLEKQNQILAEQIDSKQHSLNQLQHQKNDLGNATPNLSTNNRKLERQFDENSHESIVRFHARDKYVVFHSLQTVEGIYNQLEIVGSCLHLRNVVVLDEANLIGSNISGTIISPTKRALVNRIGLNINIVEKILSWEEIAQQYNLR